MNANYYPQLARALLDCGDTPQLIGAFLRAEYGLDRDQANAAIVLARGLKTEAERELREEREPRPRIRTRH